VIASGLAVGDQVIVAGGRQLPADGAQVVIEGAEEIVTEPIEEKITE